MHAIQANIICFIPFLDCRGYYDLAAQIIGLLLTGVILYWSLANYRELKREKNLFNDSEYEHSLRRKIRVNLLNIIFLLIFVTHIIFSMILFQVTAEQSPAQVVSNQLEKWYKTTEVFFVELLNVLLLTVGWLYWKGLHFFYSVKELEAPLPFRKSSKYILCACGLYCIASFISGIILVFLQTDDNQFIQNLLVLISSIISMLLFLFFRMAYYANIFRSIKMGKKIIIRQRIYNSAIILSSFARMALCIFGMIGVQLDQLRRYNSDCHDTSPMHGVVLLSTTVCVDLLPSYIFARIFTTFQRQKHLHADIEQTLNSIQPSEMVSGLQRQ